MRIAIIVCTIACLLPRVQAQSQTAPIPIKVVVVTMFERGEDTGDTPGEFQLWVEREHLDQVIPLAAGYHHLRLNKDGVLGLLTGVGTAKAAASVMALGTDPRFDLSKAYWVVAGIGGGDPADVSLGSAVWADHVIDGDISYEVDARDIPPDWPTGYVPLRKSRPYEQPVRSELEGERYTLNPALVGWALAPDEGCRTGGHGGDSHGARAFRGISECAEASVRHAGRHHVGQHVLAWNADGCVGERLGALFHRRQLHDLGDGRYGHDAGTDISQQRRACGSSEGVSAAHGE